MTILWFFLVITMNGQVEAYYGFYGAADCQDRQVFTAKQMKGLVRDVTDCIGIPIKGGAKK